jgi:hypothetical protein
LTDGRGDGWNWDLTYKGQTLMTFFLKPSNEGMVLGFAAKELGDVHLTIFSKEGRTFCHITDKRLPLRPWNLNFDEKLLSRKIQRRVKPWIRPYAPNKRAWIMTPYLRRKLASQFPRQEGRIKMPVEMIGAELVFDRNNPKRWRKLRIRELLTRTDGPGLTAMDGRLCWVQPLDSKRMLAFTDRQFERHWDMVFKELGLDKYLEYVAAAYPELLENVKRKLKKMS